MVGDAGAWSAIAYAPGAVPWGTATTRACFELLSCGSTMLLLPLLLPPLVVLLLLLLRSLLWLLVGLVLVGLGLVGLVLVGLRLAVACPCSCPPCSRPPRCKGVSTAEVPLLPPMCLPTQMRWDPASMDGPAWVRAAQG